MQLGDIFDDLTLDIATAVVEVTRVDIDSRECQPGSLFFALPGLETNGERFIADAVANGAVAVVTAAPVTSPVPVITVSEQRLRATLGHASAAVTGQPAQHLHLVGITGTNGKTTVATLVADIARHIGWYGASMGTLTNVRTTPAAPELWRSLQQFAQEAGGQRAVVALEVSSHALVQERVLGAHFDVVAFTNLSHDHLDYHGTMEEYFAAKSLLFTPTYGSRAVIWVDDPYGAQLAASTTIPVTTVARNNAEQLTQSLHGTHFVWRGHAVTTPLIGDYNVDNVLVAMSIVSALGADDAAIAAAMTHVSPVPGRFEVVSSDGPVVIVDYAHTPDGLERLLRAIRQLHTGRIITVVGCGGDRDRAKRPVMGRVGADLSDVCIVTSDNPRHEDPEQIIDEIVAELSPDRYVRVVDRRAAIAQAIGVAQPSDVVLIAGKGHEVTQTIGDLVLPFDDRAVAREMLVH